MPIPADTLNTVATEGIRTNHLIICEGKDDLYFLNALIKRHNIPDTQVLISGNGDSGFTKRLEQLGALGHLDLVSSVLCIGDNDSDPNSKFEKLRKQLRDAGNIPVPRQRLRVASKQGQPRSAILMLPYKVKKDRMDGNRPGDLETLIWDVMIDEYPEEAKCVEEFLECTAARTWEPSPQAKMKLASLVAVTCKKDPECATIFMWQNNKKYQHLLEKTQFRPLVAYLHGLSKYVDPKREEQLKLHLGLPV